MSAPSESPGRLSRFGAPALFAAWTSAVLAVMLFFLANVVQWRDAPDFGWVPMAEYKGRAIGYVNELGASAGLAQGDRIVAINGERHQTHEQMVGHLNLEIGGETRYDLDRAGRRFVVTVTTERLGWYRAFYQIGVIWLVGMVFLGIGVLVSRIRRAPFRGQSERNSTRISEPKATPSRLYFCLIRRRSTAPSWSVASRYRTWLHRF